MADVIERMTDEFMTVLHEKRPDMGELESRRDAVKRPQEAMLAAVRELRNWTGNLEPISAQFQPIKFKDGHSAYVGDVIEKFVEFVIEDHERRSEVKRGDS